MKQLKLWQKQCLSVEGARGVLKSVLVPQNPSSLTEAIQIAVQMEQKWIKIQLAKQRVQELADMEDHKMEHSQHLEPQIIQQVNQQRARTGYQPFKPSHKFSAKTVQPKEETKNAQKETLLEDIKLSVAQLSGRAPAKTAPKPAPSGQNQLKETEMARIYHNLIVNTIAKLNASFKKPVRPYVSVLMN
jgi:hypothetical protein